jgi:hypothetical protein
VKKKAPPRRRDVRGRYAAGKSALAVRAARGALAGQSTRQIAADLGVSRVHGWRILTSEECQQIIVRVVNGQISVLESIFARGLDAIAAALSAERPTVKNKNGDAIEGGPDHYARLTAVARLLQVYAAGRPLPKFPDPQPSGGGVTLAEFQAQIAQAQSEMDGPAR